MEQEKLDVSEYLRPKSDEEIQDLERRGFRKDSKWRFNIDIRDLVKKYEKDGIVNDFRRGIVELFESRTDDISILVSKEELVKYKTLLNEMDKLGSAANAQRVNTVWDKIYDWANHNDVWIESF